MLDALYTMYFKDWLNAEFEEEQQTYASSLYDYLTDEITSHETVTNLIDQLKWQYSFWEICEEDAEVFLTILVNKILSYKDYYLEMLQAYAVEIDFLDGNKTVITREGTGSRNESGESSSDVVDKDYLLPNKSINSGKGNLSQQREGTSGSTSSNDMSNEFEETITTLGAVNVVEAKRKYLDLIRNLYYEWAKRCEDCFLGIYS